MLCSFVVVVEVVVDCAAFVLVFDVLVVVIVIVFGEVFAVDVVVIVVAVVAKASSCRILGT